MKIMKPISVLFLLVLIVLCVAVACSDATENGDETTNGTTDTQAITNGVTDGITDAETEEGKKVPITGEDGEEITDEALHAWFEYGSNLTRRDTFQVGTNQSIAISMAKNEMEGFQLLLASTVDHKDIRCEVSTLSDGQGNTLTGEVNVTYNTLIRSAGKSSGFRGFTPTAILSQDDPYVGGSFDVLAGRSKTLYILYKTDANTVPGTYTGRVEVKQGDTVLFSGDVSVTVWNIYYDEATEGVHMFGYGYEWDTWEKPGPAGAPDMRSDYPELLEIYCDALVDYRISPYYLPVGEEGVLDERAAKYLDNPRVSLTVLWGDQQKDLAVQYFEAEERGWLDKIAFLEYDEPHEEEHMNSIFNQMVNYNRRWPTMLHFNALIKDMPKDGKNIIERLATYTTLHCFVAKGFEGEVAETMLKMKEERGDTIMWYVCGDEPANMVDGLPCIPGTEKRVLFWEQYLFNLDGFLMWQTCMWEGIEDIWADGYEEQRLRPASSPDGATANGVFFYWHPETKMPLYTLGLEAMRDGIEDFQLLRMAEELLGREATLAYVTQVATSRTEYTKDADVLMAVRNALADAVEAALLA